MAVYKVPQDVEADDKLIGPFSFRQFIYLIIVAISAAGAWGLSQVFIPLAIVPLPIIILFAALALPLRKDQPMETYLTAVVSFYFLKSRKRFWQPDGINSFVTIIPPKDADKVLTKTFSEDEATRRLNYLATLVDTHGWSVRGEGVAPPDTSISTDLYYESQQTIDMMDTANASMQSLTQKLEKSTEDHKQAVRQQMNNPAAYAIPPQASTPPQPSQASQAFADKSGRDAVAYAAALAEEAAEARKAGDIPPAPPQQPTLPVQTTQQQAQSRPLPSQQQTTTSANPQDPATIELAKERAASLASRDDLTIETLSKEANRLDQQTKLKNEGEVTISLR